MLPPQPSSGAHLNLRNINDLSVVVSVSSADGSGKSRKSQRSNQFRWLSAERSKYLSKRQSRSIDGSIHSLNNSILSVSVCRVSSCFQKKHTPHHNIIHAKRPSSNSLSRMSFSKQELSFSFYQKLNKLEESQQQLEPKLGGFMDPSDSRSVSFDSQMLDEYKQDFQA